MDGLAVVVVAVEFLAVLVSGAIIGRALHSLFCLLASVFAGKKHAIRDEHFLKALEGSLQVISVVWLMYFVSGHLENLLVVNAAINKYSLSILILVSAIVVSEFISAFFKWRLSKASYFRAHVDETILPFFRKALRVFVLAVGIYFALSAVGIDLSGLLAATGIAAIVLGLAAQETLANIFAGLALQWDRPFLYGDKLQFADGLQATLKSIGLRSSKLEDKSGNEIILSNSQLAQSRIIKLGK